MKLDELRSKWESKTFTIVSEIPQDHSTLLVVLKDRHRKYHCHRYMTFDGGSQWDISCDRQCVDADEAIRWISDPRAKEPTP